MYRITIDHPKYNEDVMFWDGKFSTHTLKLCILKRKIAIAKELGLGIAAAYKEDNLGNGLVEKIFGKPQYFTIELI